jgi:hypothetical protein
MKRKRQAEEQIMAFLKPQEAGVKRPICVAQHEINEQTYRLLGAADRRPHRRHAAGQPQFRWD